MKSLLVLLTLAVIPLHLSAALPLVPVHPQIGQCEAVIADSQRACPARTDSAEAVSGASIQRDGVFAREAATAVDETAGSAAILQLKKICWLPFRRASYC